LKPGDRLLRLGDAPTNVRYDEQMPDFMRLVTGLPIGREVTAVVERDGKQITLRLVPAERGEIYPKEQELKQWGLTVRDLSFLAAREMRRTNQIGVLVTSVRPGGPAGEAKPALDPKDVITEVNGTIIKNSAALAAMTEKLTEGKSDH